MRRRWVWIVCGLLLLLPACLPGPSDGQLTVVFPQETTERAGGGPLRVTLTLVDNGGQPVAGATVLAELRAPDGSVFATLPCADIGQGRYLADYVRLPLKGSKGTWRVTARAAWGDGKQAQGERTFQGLPSPSEEIQSQAGCWIEMPRSYDCGDRSLVYKIWRYPDGTGYLMINNHCHGSICLNIYWQRADFPTDESAAANQARGLAATLEPNLELALDHGAALEPNPVVERIMFKGQTAWCVSGHWRGAIDLTQPTGYARGGSIEWVILRCPGSNYLWTVVIATTNASENYMTDLRAVRESFECPSP